jgi:hypothetical protein
MKFLNRIGFFLGLLFVAIFLVQQPHQKRQFKYSKDFSKGIVSQNGDKYSHIFEELSWLKGEKQYDAVVKDLIFFNALISGSYIDYLDLIENNGLKVPFSFHHFSTLHDQCKPFFKEESVSKESFKELFLYAILLKEIEDSQEFKERGWIYGVFSVKELFVMHQDLLPSLGRFDEAQKNLLLKILETEKCEDKDAFFQAILQKLSS